MQKIFILSLLLSSALIANQEEYQLLECELNPITRDTNRKHPSHPHMPIENITEASSNWSGYVAATNLNSPQANSVSSVAGTWNVPALSSTPNQAYCAIWVGIDGFTSPSVEQLGTSCDWVNGKQVNYAWYEMYPNYSYEISGFPVDAGDSISASVEYKGDHVFVLSMSNNTKKVKTVIPTKYTTSSTAQRSCAEWIVEAPYENSILPLAHFSQVTFSNCKATINGSNNAISKIAHAQNVGLNMAGNSGLKALTSSLFGNGQNFKVNWEGE